MITYKIVNIDNDTITYDFINSVLPANFEIDTNTDTILYQGTQASIMTLDENNISDILVHNNIRYIKAAYCMKCNEWTGDYVYINSKNGDCFVCGDCYYEGVNNGDYFYCEDCEEHYDTTYDYYTTEHNHIVCEGCYYDHYSICDDCDCVINNDDSYYCEECDRNLCEDCYNNYHNHEDDRLLYDYHEFNNWHPTHTEEENDNPPAFYIGHELEIDYGDDMRDAVHTIQTLANGICMHDGSLSSQGIEFISHPLSYKYMLSQEDNYRKTFEHLTNLGYKSHNTSDCGLHFHVTRPQNPAIIDRIILFMETYKEEIILLSRRKSDELNRWSRFLSDKRQSINDKIIKSLDYIINNKETSDRYMALNLTNSKTIEFRFFKGTLKYETFMADFEFINNLVEFASNLEIPVEELTWTLITSKGRFLPAYIEEHNLQSSRPIIDYSKELLVEFNDEKTQVRIEVDNLIAELLKNISNKARTKNNTSQKLKKTYDYIYNANDKIRTLQYMLYELENMNSFDYNRLDDVKTNLRYIKEMVAR